MEDERDLDGLFSSDLVEMNASRVVSPVMQFSSRSFDVRFDEFALQNLYSGRENRSAHALIS